MSAISTNYRELTREEALALTPKLASAWQDPEIPRRQYERAVKPELEERWKGRPCRTFQVLIDCMMQMEWLPVNRYAKLLDIGASSGYYKEVIGQFAGIQYTGCDYSPAFKQLAEELYPGIDFHVADACQLPFHDDAFDIVLHGAAIMHILDWQQAVREAVRVSRRYVIFHRTPILRRKETSYFLKEAYDVPCIEIHFNETELLNVFSSLGLVLRYSQPVFWHEQEGFGHQTYLLEQPQGLRHVQV